MFYKACYALTSFVVNLVYIDIHVYFAIRVSARFSCNQREKDRERANARAGGKKGQDDDGLTPEQRRESLIVGYAQFGYGDEALHLFRDMKSSGVKPNRVTFVGVLTACSHVGLLEEGWQLYNSMEIEHGIVPTKEHCSCVVDLLARAGCIKEAEAFINQLPFDPDIVVWKTLLAACKTNNNVEVAKRAAESILSIDPSNSAAHVMLCSIYASSGNWKDVARLRSLMKQNGVMKVPGQSWIEVKDKMYVFLAEDCLHPESDHIYSLLDELWLQMLDSGFVPLRK